MSYTTPPGKPVAVENPAPNSTEHPAIADEPWQLRRKYFRGGVADIDYDLEPYRTFSDSEAGGSNSKPRDDFETARLLNREHTNRARLF